MIASIRLDICLDDLCMALADRTDPRFTLFRGTRSAPTGGRVVCPVSRARDGLSWLLARCGTGPGDEVLVTDLMCDTVGYAVQTTGARLVTYGLVPGTFEPSPEACERAVSGRTRALIIPHLYGMRTDLADLAAIADRHGLLLIEDSALVFPTEEDAVEDYQTPAACVLYSFNYGKPLALGWGGAVSLSPALVSRVGLPSVIAMDAEDDRFYAAALLLGYVMTDASRAWHVVLHADAGLHLLVAEGGGRRPASPDRVAVDEVFQAAAKGPDAVLAWCDAKAAGVRPAWGTHLPPEVAGLLKRAHAAATRWRLVPTGAAGPADAGPMETLRSGGYAERLLEIQRRSLEEAAGVESRRATAAFYAANLDPSKWIFPGADQAAYWLSYPVAARRRHGCGGVRRDRLARRIATELAVDVHPYVWPDVLHRIPCLQGAVKAGPGSADSARLVDGLLNLPVHAQMTAEKARALVELLNAES